MTISDAAVIGCELGLDALAFGRELIDLRVVGVEICALRNARDRAIDLNGTARSIAPAPLSRDDEPL